MVRTWRWHGFRAGGTARSERLATNRRQRGPPIELIVAVVAYHGVLADESHVLRDVFGRIPGARVVTVGAAEGVVAGPGGVQLVDATFARLGTADVVAVPGGLGSHRHPEIGWWISAADPTWIVTASTGSALLAAAGLLRGRTAVTHWLAGPLLERHGAIAAAERLVVDPPFVTCSGPASLAEAALAVVRQLGGAELEASVRADLAAHPAPEPPPVPCTSPARYRPRRRKQMPSPARHRAHVVELEVEVEVEIELEVGRRGSR